MKHFKDTAGREWEINLTVTSVKRIRDRAGLDLMDMTEDESNAMIRLSSDPILLGDVIYAACQTQADRRGISSEEFGESLAGDVIDDATTAFIDALTDFFPNPRRRAILKRAAGMLKDLEGETLDKAEKMMQEMPSLPGH